ncbi:MAG: ABC transporter ATP-binding protein/permease [Acholeplasma sp.]|nr:ABC transporter ATP-binding protein/permease [Acholeplasma sp.]
MIKTTNLNKYFNRRKKNEIHVMNDISIELPDSGLIVLFGPSGSGKTTLLNVIGGLDRASGKIDLEGIELDHYHMSKWDKIRNEKIGYIFQNYMLLEHLSIYDNIKLVLNMVGITDKDEINKRVEYLLESVGMKNYKKRKAGLLSGGQQQRVAIARALSKNPNIIIADEPTGNLDSKNTVEVMNIIKKISKTKLVLLVTHEKEIADFYADRVIELNDGKIINDRLNEATGSLDLKHESDIYLKDLNMVQIDQEHLDYKFYSDQPSEKLKFNIIYKNGTLYLDLRENGYKNIKLLDDNSNVKLINEHYKAVDSKDVNTIGTYDYENIIDDSKRNKRQPIITVKHAVKLAFSKILNQTKKRRMLFVGFALAGFLLTIASGLVTRLNTEMVNPYLSVPENYIVVDNVINADLYNQLFTDSSTKHIRRPYERVSFDFDLLKVYQSSQSYFRISMGVEYSTVVSSSDIVYGRNIQNPKEVLLDISGFEGYYTEVMRVVRAFGYNDYKPFLNQTITVQNTQFKVVGFTNMGQDYIVMNELEYLQVILGSPTETNLNVLRTLYYTANYPETSSLAVYSSDPVAHEKRINDLNTEMKADYRFIDEQEEFSESMRMTYTIFNVFIGVILGITWISLFFVMRGSLLERVSEISVFRALGVRRIDIIKSYVVEILIITTVSFALGYLFGYYYFTNMNKGLIDGDIIKFTPITISLSLLLIYTANQVIGLIPVLGLLRKTPAQIMSSYDA